MIRVVKSQTWSAMIVPIRVGGGTRVKIAQALSRKCPVVSTSLGAFGYNVIDRGEILIANDPRPHRRPFLVKFLQVGMQMRDVDRAGASRNAQFL
jgi:hypothetical protein